MVYQALARVSDPELRKQVWEGRPPLERTQQAIASVVDDAVGITDSAARTEKVWRFQATPGTRGTLFSSGRVHLELAGNALAGAERADAAVQDLGGLAHFRAVELGCQNCIALAEQGIVLNLEEPLHLLYEEFVIQCHVNHRPHGPASEARTVAASRMRSRQALSAGLP